jgi:hypothetical protein
MFEFRHHWFEFRGTLSRWSRLAATNSKGARDGRDLRIRPLTDVGARLGLGVTIRIGTGLGAYRNLASPGNGVGFSPQSTRHPRQGCDL